jgi:hypothetical protein
VSKGNRGNKKTLEVSYSKNTLNIKFHTLNIKVHSQKLKFHS